MNKNDKGDCLNEFRDSLQGPLKVKLASLSVAKDAGFGATLTATVSPCVWMYDSTFQISVKMTGGGNTIVIENTVQSKDATEADVERLLNTVRLKICKCHGCQRPAFDPATTVKHRDGKCEQCFLDRLNLQLEKDQRRAANELATLDSQYKAKGFTYRIDAGIRSLDGDQLISIWISDTSPSGIRSELQNNGVQNLDDYSLHAL